MGTILHVGNLDWDVSADDLFAMFHPHGQVLHAQVIMDHEKGRSRGFGFVEMADAEEARRVMSLLHGRAFHARPIQVTVARGDPRLA